MTTTETYPGGLGGSLLLNKGRLTAQGGLETALGFPEASGDATWFKDDFALAFSVGLTFEEALAVLASFNVTDDDALDRSGDFEDALVICLVAPFLEAAFVSLVFDVEADGDDFVAKVGSFFDFLTTVPFFFFSLFNLANSFAKRLFSSGLVKFGCLEL